jgi:hypothetical protein
MCANKQLITSEDIVCVGGDLRAGTKTFSLSIQFHSPQMLPMLLLLPNPFARFSGWMDF